MLISSLFYNPKTSQGHNIQLETTINTDLNTNIKINSEYIAEAVKVTLLGHVSQRHKIVSTLRMCETT